MLELKTDSDVVEFTRAVSLSLAQILHEMSGLGEPGRTYNSIEQASNAWNATCIEMVGVQNDKFILFARAPQVLLETDKDGKTWIWDALRDFVEKQWGWKLLLASYNDVKNESKDIKLYSGSWHLFGPDLDSLLDESEDRDQLLDLYFNTFEGTLRGDM